MSILLSNLLVISTIGLTGGARHLPPVDPGRELEGAKFALELDGVVVGWVANLQGGAMGSDVVEEKLGSDVVARKHLGNVKYEEISFRTGLELSTKFYDWIKAGLAGDFTQRTGAIITTDFNFKPIRRLEFTRALISEICLPAMDASSKEAGWFTFRLSPEATKQVNVRDGSRLPAPMPRKSWLSSDYRLTLDGLDCSKVARIAGLNIKEKVVETGTLHVRDTEGIVVDPPVNVTVPEASVAQYDTWLKNFVLAGAASASKEKTGQIDFLAPDQKTTLCTLTLSKVGIHKITPEKSADGKAKSEKVELYFEHAKLVM